MKHLVVAAAVLALLTSFGEPSRVAAQTTDQLRISTPGNDAADLVYYAMDGGFFKNHGIDAQVGTLVKGSGAANAAAVAGGAVDIAEADLVAVAAAREHGLDLSILAPSGLYNGAAPTTVLVVAKDSPIKSALDLTDKTIAVPSLTGPSRVAIDAWLDQNHVDPARVKFIELPPPTMAAALSRGVCAAAVISEPNLANALAGQGRVLANALDSLGKRWLISGWVVRGDWVTKNPALAKRFIAAMHDAAVWANQAQNHPKTALILEKYSKISPALIANMTRATYAAGIDLAIMRPLLDAAAKYKSIEQTVSATDLISPIALAK